MSEFKGQTVKEEILKILGDFGVDSSDAESVFEAMSEVYEMLHNHTKLSEPYATKSIERYRQTSYELFSILEDEDLMNEIVQG